MAEMSLSIICESILKMWHERRRDTKCCFIPDLRERNDEGAIKALKELYEEDGNAGHAGHLKGLNNLDSSAIK